MLLTRQDIPHFLTTNKPRTPTPPQQRGTETANFTTVTSYLDITRIALSVVCLRAFRSVGHARVRSIIVLSSFW